MSITGIVMPDQVLKAFEQVKVDDELKGIMIAIHNEALVIDRMIKEEFDTFVNSSIQSDVPKYIIYDFLVPNKSGILNKKLVLISWIPMASPVFERMKYAATKTMVRRSFPGVALDIHLEEREELTGASLKARFVKDHRINM
ncbi:MAG: hypothetical protein ACTSYA_06690 [Candidatus Kariarchaeaceae archaeon]